MVKGGAAFLRGTGDERVSIIGDAFIYGVFIKEKRRYILIKGQTVGIKRDKIKKNI